MNPVRLRLLRSRLWPATAAPALCLSLGLWAASLAPASAQGTDEQRQACQSDAFRLCNEFIPDVGRTTSCLYKNNRKLSTACRTVMYGKTSTRKRHTRHRRWR